MKHVRLTAAAISAFLVVGTLGGCGKKDTGSDSSSAAPAGRYVEEELALPAEWSGWSVKQLFTEEEKLHFLITKEEGERLQLQEWEQQGDTFADVTEDWLNTLELPAQTWMELKLMQDGNGVQYLFAEYVEEDAYKGHLWRSSGETALDITPEKWTVPDEETGYFEYIYGIGVLDNGTLAASCSRSVDILYGEDGSLLESEEVQSYYAETVLSDGENIYLFSADNGSVITEVEKRPGGRGSEMERIPFAQSVPELLRSV